METVCEDIEDHIVRGVDGGAVPGGLFCRLVRRRPPRRPAARAVRVEQIYVNVPEMDVFFYALDAQGNSYTPMVVQAAGLELTVGDQHLDTSSLGQADSPICYLVALDNSADIDPVDFRQMRAAIWQLIRSKGENDQIALYTLAGGTTLCAVGTSDSTALYKALAAIQQADGQMDMAGAAARVASDIQRNTRPWRRARRCLSAPTDSASSPTRRCWPGLLTDVSSKLNVAMYTFVGSGSPDTLAVLNTMSDGRIIPMHHDRDGGGTAGQTAAVCHALELRTEVPESLYGERQEIVTLSAPSLGSAVQSSSTVYMGFQMEKPMVDEVQVLGRNKLELTMNQASTPTPTRPQFYMWSPTISGTGTCPKKRWRSARTAAR